MSHLKKNPSLHFEQIYIYEQMNNETQTQIYIYEYEYEHEYGIPYIGCAWPEKLSSGMTQNRTV